ncbi:MAG: hypoxanthine phosphoribosyltransferase [Actinomycetaceae bacterium]|nr:hypoxanthine phosphoribosyltransferase [Actinomycetaceae bacterium]
MAGDLEEILVTAEDMDKRLDEIAGEIDAYYQGEQVLMIGVLRGSLMIMADLSRKLSTPVAMDWMALSSYGSGTQSSGVVRILKDLTEDIKVRHVLIVEDIIDSGLTLSWLVANLETREPASIKIVTAVRKSEAVCRMNVNADWVAFDLPDAFLVGYGLDYNEKYRNLPFICTLAEHVYTS